MKTLLAVMVLAASMAAEPLKIGSRLPAVAGLDPQKAAASVIVFVSVDCPVSNAYNERMNTLYREYSARHIQFSFVNSNANESTARMQQHAKANELAFQVVKDENNALADQLGALSTPETFVFDRTGTLIYHGFIDDSRNEPAVRVRGLRDALESVLAGKPVQRPETRAFGCTIKRVKKTS